MCLVVFRCCSVIVVFTTTRWSIAKHVCWHPLPRYIIIYRLFIALFICWLLFRIFKYRDNLLLIIFQLILFIHRRFLRIVYVKNFPIFRTSFKFMKKIFACYLFTNLQWFIKDFCFKFCAISEIREKNYKHPKNFETVFFQYTVA